MQNILKHWAPIVSVFTVGGFEALGSHNMISAGVVTVVVGALNLLSLYANPPVKP